MVDDREEVVIARVSDVCADLDLIASLAGLRLAAQRLGIDVRVREPCGTMHDLIVLAGLADVLLGDVFSGDVLLADRRRRLGTEVGWQAEGVELLRAEEGGPAGDLAT